MDMEPIFQDGRFVRDMLSLNQHIIYRWWFDEFPQSSNSKNVLQWDKILNRIQHRILYGHDYYALYLGEAVCAAVRLSQHVPYHNVKGFNLSTLRMTLGACLFELTDSAEIVAKKVDTFMIEHAYVEWMFTETTEREDLHRIENEMMQYKGVRNYFYPLNIQNNYNAPKEDWLNKLSDLRKQFSQKLTNI